MPLFAIMLPWDTVPRHGNYFDWSEKSILRGWTHGDRIVSTYGPLAFLSFRIADSQLYWPRIFFSAVLVGFTGGRLIQHGFQLLPPLAAVAWLFVSFLPISLFGWLEYSPVLWLPYAACVALALEAAQASGHLRWGGALAYGASLASFCLMKISYAPLALVACGIYLAAELQRHRWMHAAGLLVGGFSTLAVVWLTSGQRLDALPQYVINSIEAIAGFKDAMCLWRPASAEAWGYFIIAAAFLSAALILRTISRGIDANAAATLIIFSCIGHSAAAGFTRADPEHFVYALLTLATVTLLALPSLILPWNVFRPRSLLLSRAPACCALVSVAVTLAVTLPLMPRFAVLFVHRCQAMAAAISGNAPSIPAPAEDVGCGLAGGRIDATAEEDGFLAESCGTPWPRPTLTSYAAYTPHLAQINQRFLESSNGPDSIIMRDHDLGDRMFPTIRDNRSYLTMISHYSHEESHGARHLFTRRHEPLTVSSRLRATIPIHGDFIEVPSSRYIWCVIKLRRPLPASAFRLQPSALMMEVRAHASDGTEHEFVARLVPAMAADGFVLTPCVVEPATMPALCVDSAMAAPVATRIRLAAFDGVTYTTAGVVPGSPLRLEGILEFHELTVQRSVPADEKR
jgi:hypothetical protein